MKRFSFTVLIVLILVSLIAGCTVPITQPTEPKSQATTPAPTETEPPKEPDEIVVFSRERWAGASVDTYVMNRLQEETNTKWIIKTASDLTTELNKLFLSKDFPDLFNFSGNDTFERQLVADGILLPLNEHFDKAPNLAKRREAVWDLMRHPDGNIYSMNASYSSMDVSFAPFYRKDWLDTLNLGIPTTLDEYITVAEAVTKQDPDGNGKNDTYAIGVGDGDGRYYQHILVAHGVIGGYWLPDDNGSLIYGNIAPGMRDALKVLNTLFNKGVFDPEFITDNAARVKEKYTQGVYGALCLPLQIFDENNLNNYYIPFKEANPEAIIATGPILKGSEYYDDDFGLAKLSPRGWVRAGVYAGTKKLDAVMRVLDYMCTDEGMMLQNYGEEGVDYKMENGTVTYLVDADKQKERGLTQCNICFDWLFLDTSKAFQNIMTETNKTGIFNMADGIFVEEASLYEADLKAYFKTQILKIITGEVPVDEGYEQMLAEWKRRGGEELSKAYNEAYKAKMGK